MGTRVNPLYILAVSFLVFQGCHSLTRTVSQTNGLGCIKEGLNPHPYDSHMFLICVKDAIGNLKPKPYTCPDYQVYSDTKKTCVEQIELPEDLRVEDDHSAECGKQLINCVDCNVIVFCQQISDDLFVPIGNYTCNGTTPYCDSVAKGCTATKPPSCYEHSDCTGLGVFPNIKNCTIFYSCDANKDNTGIISGTHWCAKKQVYNGLTDIFKGDIAPYCMERTDPSTCVTVHCEKGMLEVKPYRPPDSQLYVICLPDGKTYYVYKCAGTDVFNPDTKQCAPKTEG